MTKRKSSVQSTVPNKKPRLDDAETIPTFRRYIAPGISYFSWPPPPVALGKRKRPSIPEAESESLEEPEARRVKTSDSQGDRTTDSDSSSSISICSLPSESEEYEGPNPEVEAFRRAYRNAMARGSPSQSPAPPNLLPSPELSDRDGTESDGTASDETEGDESGLPIITSTVEFIRGRDATPPYKKQRQPPKKGKVENERNKRRNNSRQHAVEIQHTADEMLRSKRSSRRDHNCKLWQLGDDGIARKVLKAR